MARLRASLVVLVVCLAGVGAAQAQEVRLAGRVMSAAGQPVPGAEVIVQSAQGGVLTTLSDETGQFELSLEPGAYRITVKAVGFSPTTEALAVPAGKSTVLALVMPEIVRERVNVVGTSRAAEKIPGSAAVIAPQEMERLKLATGDIHQMLRQIPGLNIQEEEGYGLRPNIGMRGTGTDRSSKITLMEDGVLIAPAPYAAPAAYYAPIAGRMESLEVRKGSSQVKYGPITTGGVLNYVSTSIPSDLRLRTTLAGGGDGTRRLTANVGDSYRNFGWLVETFQFENNGFKQLDGGGGTGVDLESYMTKFRVNTTPRPTMYQEFEIKIGRTDQVGDETYLGLTDADFARTPYRRYAASHADVFESSHRQYQARHLLARGSWDLTTVAYRNDFRRVWYKLDSVLGSGLAAVLHAPGSYPAPMAVITGADSDPNALVLRNNNRGYYGAGVQSVLGLPLSTGRVGHQIEAGIRYHRDEEDRFQHDDAYQMVGGRMVLTRPGAPGSQANQVAGASAVAGFIADTLSWGRWNVSPGLRYESIDLKRTTYARTDPARIGTTDGLSNVVRAVIPGLGMSYEVRPGVSLISGIHRGFAPPGPGAARGTDVEHSVNYELGARLQQRGVSTEAFGFFNDYGNLLGRDSLASGGSGEGQRFNGGRARVHGLEASAQWNPAVGSASALPIRVAYTFTHAEFRNDFQSQFGPWGNVRIGDELPYVPRHQLYTSVETDHRQWRARIDASYAGRMRTVAGHGPLLASESTDAAMILNVSGEYRLTNGFSLFASVQNLTDKVYIIGRHPSGVRPNLPRHAQAGLKIGFGG